MKGKLDPYLFIPIIIIITISIYLVIQISGFDVMKPKAKHSRDKGNEGFFLLYNLLDHLGYKIRTWNQYNAPGDKGCFVILNYQEKDKGILTEVLKWVEEGSTVILFGIETDEDPVFNEKITVEKLEKVKIGAQLGVNIHLATLTASQFLRMPQKGDVLIGEDEKVVLYRTDWGKGTIFILTDSQLANNKSLQDKNMAILFNNLFKEFYLDPIYFFESKLVVSNPGTPVLFLFRKPFFFFTIHLLFWGILFLLYSAKQFGSPRHIYINPRRTILEHIKGTASFYEKTRSGEVIEDLNREYFIYQLMQKRKLKKAHPAWEEINNLGCQLKIDPIKLHDLIQSKNILSKEDLIKRRQERDQIFSKI